MELLNPKIDKRIKNKVEKEMRHYPFLPNKKLTDEEWLDKEELKRMAREKFAEGFVRVNTYKDESNF